MSSFEAYAKHLSDHLVATAEEPYETTAVWFREQQARFDRWREEERRLWERRILAPLWRQVWDEYAMGQARSEAIRPTIGKPLSRRARRRNRGRVRAAKAALMRTFQPSVSWSWGTPGVDLGMPSRRVDPERDAKGWMVQLEGSAT